MCAFLVFIVCTPILPSAIAQSPCGDARLQLSPDYSFAVGSSSDGGHFTFTDGGKTLFRGTTPQLALFHYNEPLESTSGIMPSESAGTAFLPGKFGEAVTVGAKGSLNYPVAGHLSLEDGTVEMWVAPQYDGNTWTKDAIYELVAGGTVRATATIDQTSAAAGDAWHMIATANLRSGDSPFLRVRNGGSDALIADAVYIKSAALYNDGAAAPQVTPGGFDAILLERSK